MKINIIRSEEHKTQTWSGGTTTQLFIYPLDSDYKSKTFDFRISTATVEQEFSEFTPLSGVSRKLMVLEGELKIEHKNHHHSILKPLDVDRFDGAWQTSSIGLCTDFNLMCTADVSGDITGVALEKNKPLELNSDAGKLLLYLYKGGVFVSFDEQIVKLKPGDLICFDDPHSVIIESKEDSIIAISEIRIK